MKASSLAVALLLATTSASAAFSQPAGAVSAPTRSEQQLLDLSRERWVWMAERKLAALDALFHEKAKFVHMGGTMTKVQELEVIRTGSIQYKKVDIEDASVQLIGDTRTTAMTLAMSEGGVQWLEQVSVRQFAGGPE